MGTDQITVHGTLRRKHTDMQSIGFHFLFQFLCVLIAIVIQDKMGQTTPHLDGLKAQFRLALQEIIQGVVHIMDSHPGQLFSS